jgi:hypothetical protein
VDCSEYGLERVLPLPGTNFRKEYEHCFLGQRLQAAQLTQVGALLLFASSLWST